MAGYGPYSGTRTVIDNGTSVHVTIPKEGLDALGIEPEDIAGEDLPATVENGEFKLNLEGATVASD